MASAALWTSHDVGGSRRGRVGGRADSRGGDGSTKRGHCRTLGSQARRTDGAGKHRVGPRSQHLYKPKKSPDVTDSSVSHHITPPWSRPTCVSLARPALLSATDNFISATSAPSESFSSSIGLIPSTLHKAHRPVASCPEWTSPMRSKNVVKVLIFPSCAPVGPKSYATA
jgi:hypothetical protein